MSEFAGIPMPETIGKLPIGPNGFPVPWFVAWVDGRPEFRCADPKKLKTAIRHRRCWVCGGPIDGWLAFVIGPMCSVNRVSAEPHCHRECAVFSARACPFLSKPHMVRRENDLPEGTSHAGHMIRRNPGCCAVWVTKSYELVGDGYGKALFRVGPPAQVLWFAEGRAATRAEVLASVESGLPLLRGPAADQGPAAVAHLDRLLEDARQYFPAEGPAA